MDTRRGNWRFHPLGRKVALWMPDKVQVVFGVTLRPNSGNPTGHGCVFRLGFFYGPPPFLGRTLERAPESGYIVASGDAVALCDKREPKLGAFGEVVA